MIALDTNLLVYAHREDSARHARAVEVLQEGLRRPGGLSVPWPCMHEFLAVVTHPRIYAPPTPMALALDSVRALHDHPSVHLLAEGRDHLEQMARLLATGQVVGPRVHDARIAAICLSHGIDELWSADRDFSWFPGLRTVNPLA